MQNDPMRPAITLGRAEHRQLLILAMIGPGQLPEDSDFLNYELDRATIVPDRDLPADIVRLGSTVTYRSQDRTRVVTLVYPEHEDSSAGHISVLSPVGAALIGLRPGQSITRMGWDGAFVRFRVLAVRTPSDGGSDPDKAPGNHPARH